MFHLLLQGLAPTTLVQDSRANTANFLLKVV